MQSLRNKSVIAARVIFAVPLVFSLMGATGKSTAFSCGGEMLEVIGPCDADGGIPCTTDGGTSVVVGNHDNDDSTPPRLELVPLPSSTVAPGHIRVMSARVIGTPAQVEAVQRLFWVLSPHVGIPLNEACPDSDPTATESCLGRFGDLGAGGSTERMFIGSSSFFAPYRAYFDNTAGDCEDQPANGVDVDITAFAKGLNGAVSLAATTTVHVGCPAFAVSPASMTIAPGGQTYDFSAINTDGTPASVMWSVQTLDGSLSAGGSIDPMGLYHSPATLPSASPLVLVTATSVLDLSLSDASLVVVQSQPVSVNITSPSGTFIPKSTPYDAFTAEVHHFNPLANDPSVIWSLHKGTASGPEPTNPMHISLSETGQLTVREGMGGDVLSEEEQGAYVVTATSAADETKSDHLTIYIYHEAHATTLEITNPTEPVTLKPGETQQFTATVVDDPAGDTSVTWSAVCSGCSPAGLSSIDSSTGLFTARHVGATSSETWTVTATHGTGMGAPTATLTLTVTGPIGVAISPTSMTVAPGDTVGPFTATVTNAVGAQAAVTWTGAVATSTPSVTFSPTTQVLTVSPTSSTGTYTVTATSVGDPSKSASVTVTVGSDSTGVSGTVKYAGTKTGVVYVECEDTTGGNATSGTVALTSFPTNSMTSPVPFRIHGGTCAGGSKMTAWMDTLGVGRFVYGADPSVTATVPSSGARAVDLTLADYVAAVPPTTGMTGPTITSVRVENGGAVVFYDPFVDGSSPPREFAQEYRIYATRQISGVTTGLVTTTPQVVVKPGTFGMAFVPIEVDGNYQFGIQAKFTSLGGTSSLNPATPTPTSSVPFPVSSGSSIWGSTNRSAVTTVPSTGARLHALAFNSSDAIVGAGGMDMSPSNPITDYQVVGLSSSTDYSLRLIGDLNGNGQIDPTDLFAPLLDPFQFFTTGLTTGYAATVTTPGSGSISPSSVYAFGNEKASVRVLTNYDAGSPLVKEISYVVTSGLKPVAQVTRLSGPAWESDANRDLYCADHLASSQVLRRNTFVATTMFDSMTTVPEPDDTVTLRIKYVDGASEDVTVTVHYLNYGSGTWVTASPAGAIPTFTWSSPAHSGKDTIHHYELAITGSGAPTSSILIANTATTYTYSATSLTNDEDYGYTFTAYDVLGSRRSYTGTFHTEPASP